MRYLVALVVVLLVTACASYGVPQQHARDPENAKVEALVQSEAARQAEAKRPDPAAAAGELSR